MSTPLDALSFNPIDIATQLRTSDMQKLFATREPGAWLKEKDLAAQTENGKKYLPLTTPEKRRNNEAVARAELLIFKAGIEDPQSAQFQWARGVLRELIKHYRSDVVAWVLKNHPDYKNNTDYQIAPRQLATKLEQQELSLPEDFDAKVDLIMSLDAFEWVGHPEEAGKKQTLLMPIVDKVVAEAVVIEPTPAVFSPEVIDAGERLKQQGYSLTDEKQSRLENGLRYYINKLADMSFFKQGEKEAISYHLDEQTLKKIFAEVASNWEDMTEFANKNSQSYSAAIKDGKYKTILADMLDESLSKEQKKLLAWRLRYFLKDKDYLDYPIGEVMAYSQCIGIFSSLFAL